MTKPSVTEDERKKLIWAAVEAVLARIEARKPGKPTTQEIQDVINVYFLPSTKQ